ncbi:hypothetical protein D3C79_1084270 [compost metagenome]
MANKIIKLKKTCNDIEPLSPTLMILFFIVILFPKVKISIIIKWARKTSNVETVMSEGTTIISKDIKSPP